MEYLIGALLALAVGAFASLVGLDRERGFYPVVTIIVASYYMLFAAMGGSPAVLLEELPMVALFVLVAVMGFKRNLWLVVVALAGHGFFDLVHPHLIANRGAPAWWPMFCLSYDVMAAAYLTVLLLRARSRQDMAAPARA